MTAHNNETDLQISSLQVIAESDGLRVSELTLAPGEALPWHYHSEVSDRFYCLTGALRVDCRTTGQVWHLAVGESCEVAARNVHRASNDGPQACHYVLVQGMGRYDFQMIEAEE